MENESVVSSEESLAKLRKALSRDRYAASAGVELIDVGKGFARSRMLITENHLNGGGVCQGGALFTLADFTFAAVANVHTNVTLTLNMGMTFVHAVDHGYVYAEAMEIYSHQKVPYIEVRLADESGTLVAIASGTGYRKHQKWGEE